MGEEEVQGYYYIYEVRSLNRRGWRWRLLDECKRTVFTNLKLYDSKEEADQAVRHLTTSELEKFLGDYEQMLNDKYNDSYEYMCKVRYKAMPIGTKTRLSKCKCGRIKIIDGKMCAVCKDQRLAQQWAKEYS